MFTVIEADEAREIEATARTKGMYLAMIKNLTEFYKEWASDKSNEDRPFVVPLNANPGDIFHGKATDSLYTGIMYALGKADAKKEWRLIKRNDTLLIAKL